MKPFSLVTFLAMCVLSGVPAWAVNGVLQGTGTVLDPWLVSDYADLKVVGTGTYSLSGVYRLTADIEASVSKSENCDGAGVCAGFIPIGVWKTSFGGVFHGAGHVIRNLSINRPIAEETGLFGVAYGTIDSLGLENVDVTGHGDVGGLMGYAKASVNAVYVTGRVVGDSGRVGALAGWNGGTIQRSFAAATVEGDSAVGGLVGQSGGKIYDSYAMSRVSGSVGVGGLVGRVDGEVRRCYAVSSVKYTAKGGALIGEVFSGMNLAGPWTGSVAESYWSRESFAQDQSSESPRTNGFWISEMRITDNFAGFDWNIWSQGKMQSFPVLPWVRNVAQAIPDTLMVLPDTTGTMNASMISELTRNDLDPQNAKAVLTARWVDSSAYLRMYQVGIVRSTDTLWGSFGTVRLYAHHEISSYSDLKKIAVDPFYPPYGDYRLSADIDASASENENCDGNGLCAGFTPIGSAVMPFTGTFNGKGHFIRNLYISVSGGKRVGLFSMTGTSALVDSLGLVNLSVTGDSMVGSFVGDHRGVLRACYATGRVQGSVNVGGLIGIVVGVAGDTTVGRVENSYSANLVEGVQRVGGLAGSAQYGVFRNLYAQGSVQGDNLVGGLLGINDSSEVKYALALGPVFANSVTGGLVGTDYDGMVSEAYWNREIAGQDTSAGSSDAQGLTTAQLRTVVSYAGWDFAKTWKIEEGKSYPSLRGINNAPYAFASVEDEATPEPEVQGYDIEQPTSIMVGRWLNHSRLNIGKDSVYHFYQIGSVRALDDSIWGGVSYAAYARGPIEISSYAELKKIGNDPSYPLWANYIQTADIDASESKTENPDANNVYAGFAPIGTIEYPFTGRYHGKGFAIRNLTINRPTGMGIGLFGIASAGAVLDSVVLWNASVAGKDRTGSLVGWFTGDSIHACHATANVQGLNSYVGGLVGQMQGILTESYATGQVNGTKNYTGGLVGYNLGIISRSYAAVITKGYWRAGGLVGMNSGNIKQSYTQGSVQSDYYSAGFIGEMKSGHVEENYAAVSGGSSGIFNQANGNNCTKCYWDAERAQTGLDMGRATAYSTGRMLQKASFQKWDFASVWKNVEGKSYPVLRGLDNAPMAFDDEMAVLPDTTGGISAVLLATLIANDQDADLTGRTLVARWVDSSAISRHYQVGELVGADTLWGGIAKVKLKTISISSYADLKKIGVESDYPLTGNYQLTNDIDASLSGGENCVDTVCAGFMPIGNSQPFRGTFHGAGHEIRSLHIERPELAVVGLFGYLKGAWVDSLGVVNAMVNGNSYVGGLAGRSDSSTIFASFFTGSVYGKSTYTGGLLGYMDYQGALLYSHVLGTVNGYDYAAGIIGENNGFVQNSYGQVNVVARNGGLGAVIGYVSWINASGTILDTYASGMLSQGNSVFVRTQGGVRYNTFSDSLPLAETALRLADSYSGWDQETIWQIKEGVSYPYLRGLPGALFAFPTVAKNYSVQPVVKGFFADQPSAKLVGRWTSDSCLNATQDSLYKYYQIGAVRGIQDTLWGGVSYVAKPFGAIIIASYADLEKIGNDSEHPLWASYRLTKNIDASASISENSGAGFMPIGKFTGSFHGGGHVIRNLHINRPSLQYVGLFSQTISGALIDSLGVVGASVKAYYRGGALVGGNSGHIEACFGTGSIEGGGQIGGLTGYNNGEISHSYSFADVFGSNGNIGGLVGDNGGGTISFSFATGNVKGESDVGGLVGYSYPNGKIHNSYATGNVQATSYGVGGLGGVISGETTNSYATGRVSSPSSWIGGLLAALDNGSVLKNAYSVGEVSSHTGGLLGSVNTSYFQYKAPIGGYWDKQASQADSSQGMPDVVGVNTVAMRQQLNFSGWDFDQIWSIVPEKSYPYLQGLDNAPFAFADTVFTSKTVDLSVLLDNDYDPETGREALILRVEKLIGGTTDSSAKAYFTASAKMNDTLRVYYRVGEVRASDTLWGGHALTILILNDLAPVFKSTHESVVMDATGFTCKRMVGGTFEVAFNLAQEGQMHLSIYDQKGKLLIDHNLGYMSSGNHQSLVTADALSFEALIAVLRQNGRMVSRVHVGRR